VEQLSEWRPSAQCAATLPARMEELWVFLYERGYVQMQDVVMQQKWIEALIKAGYRFPAVLSEAQAAAAWATTPAPKVNTTSKVKHAHTKEVHSITLQRCITLL
jgi:hypothetical protein